MFTKSFGAYVCEGDMLTCEVDGFRLEATLYRDDDASPHDYELPPEAVAAWKRGEWQYFGIAVTVWRGTVCLSGEYDHALWGIEGNYPGGGEDTNSHFRDIANEYIAEALADAKAFVAKWAKEDAR